MAKQTGSYDFTAARAAAEMADDISQHFWTKSTGGTTDIPTGSYVTEVPEEEFTDPNHVNYCAGGNLVLQSNRVRMRMAAVTLAELTGTALNIYEPSDSVNPTAQFTGSGTIIGKETEYHISIGSSVIDFLLNTTQLFSIIWDSVYSYCALKRSAQSGTTNLYNSVRLEDGGTQMFSELVEQYNARKRVGSVGASTGSAVAGAGIQAEYDETNSGGIDITGQIGVSARSGHADGYVRGDHFYMYPAYTGSDDPAVADLDGTGNLSLNGKLSAVNSIMVGMIQMYAGSTAPSGWLICNGDAISRTTYSALFDVIGTTYGTGNGSTTFNVPDLRGRAPIGSGTGTATNATTHALGSAGGNEDAIIPYHRHKAYKYTSSKLASGSVGARIYDPNGSNGDSTMYTDYQGTSGNAVGANMMPYATINFIIFAGI